MDPLRASRILQEAALTTAQLGGDSFVLMDASDAQVENVRTSKGRNEGIVTAKKYFRVCTLLEDLEQDVSAAHALKKPGLGKNKASQQKSGLRWAPELGGPPGNLALVPFVPTAKKTIEENEDEGPAKREEMTKKKKGLVWWTLPALPPWWTRGYELVTKASWAAAASLPLLAIALALTYLICGIIYLFLHPEAVVQALFRSLDLVPNYAQFVVDRMWDQVKVELSSRFSL